MHARPSTFLLLLLPAVAQAQSTTPSAPLPESNVSSTAPLDAPGASTNATAPDAAEPGNDETNSTAAATPAPSAAEGEAERDVEILIERSTDLVGKASSASEGVVGPQQLRDRPILRPAELLETVPGVIITQHSGPAKRTSSSCAASTWITGPTWPLLLTACRSTWSRTGTGRATPTSTS